MVKIKNCECCGIGFTYEIGRGKDRKYCSDKCQFEVRRRVVEDQKTTLKECKTENCNNKANRIGAGLCEACYGRLRRRGTVEFKSIPYKTTQSAGYLRLRERDHCLTDSTGSVYEHRFVYHKHFGEGPFNCNWCGKVVTWFDMHVDHLDDNVTNNDISNLVASCPVCNQHRGREKMKRTARANGVQLTFNGKTMCVSEWAREIGIKVSALQFRLKNEDWSLERCLTTPKGNTGPKGKKEH